MGETLNHDELKDWLNGVVCGKYYIHNGLIYVHGDVDLERSSIYQFKCQFEHVTGDFWIGGSQLHTLVGCPKIVGGSFGCSGIQTSSLIGGPRHVGRNYHCDHNKLTSLEGSPRTIGHNCSIENNLLTSLEGGPKFVGRDLYCRFNKIVHEPTYSFINVRGEVIWKTR